MSANGRWDLTRRLKGYGGEGQHWNVVSCKEERRRRRRRRIRRRRM
jgi:hypothetical protein